jgi:hypothetical protein
LASIVSFLPWGIASTAFLMSLLMTRDIEII